MKSNLAYWLTANTDEAREWRATAPLEELAAATKKYRSKKMQTKTIDLAETGTEKIEQEAAYLAQNSPKRLRGYIEDFGGAVDERLAELEQMHNGGPAADWKQERRDKLLGEVEQLRAVLEILENADK